MQSGFTLIEALIILAVIGILTALAVPSFYELIQRKNLEGAVEKFTSDLNYAKTESIKRAEDVYIEFSTANACYGLALSNNCDCTETDPTDASACAIDGILKVTDMDDFGNTTFTHTFFAGNETHYNSRRGDASATGRLIFSGADDTTPWEAEVVVSSFRVHVCSDPSDVDSRHVLTYEAACPP